MKRYIAMIPARMGSKRIPKKNVRFMADKPLIQYPIDLAKESKCFDEIWVNSESDILGRFAKENHIKFHKRPDFLSTDTATNQDFVKEFLENHFCEYVVMVNSTSPLLKVETIQKFVAYINENNFDAIFTTIEERAESFYQGKPLNFPLDRKINSQDLEPVEKIVWALTAWKREHFLSIAQKGESPVFRGRVGLFQISKDESCDLDTEEDWKIAEGILLSRKMNIPQKYWA